MPARPIALICLLLLPFLSWPRTLQAAPEKESTLTTFSTDALDVRDAILDIARSAKLNVAIAPGVSGTLSLQTKDQKPDEAIAMLAATVGCVVRRVGAIMLVVPYARKARPSLAPLEIPSDKRASAVDNRRAQLRRQFGLLARASGIHLVVGPGVDGQCPLFVREAPCTDLLVTLAWLGELQWCSLGRVLFVGTPAEVTAARQSYSALENP